MGEEDTKGQRCRALKPYGWESLDLDRGFSTLNRK